MTLHERLASIVVVVLFAALLQQPSFANSPARFSDAEIESLLAPVALYPDTLLTQILIAATYPLDVVEAARFIAAHPELKGSEAVLAAAGFDWDPSVQALTAFPDVLARMDEDLSWTRAVGEAFLQQQEAVMVSLQTLRQRARLAGTLDGSEHLQIEQHGERLALAPPRHDLVYVPWYDTTSAYGEWPSRQHQPVYWAPNTHHQNSYQNLRMSRSSLFWGPGIHLDPLYYPTRLDWHRRGVIVIDRSHGQPWQHRVKDRRGQRQAKADPRHDDRQRPDSRSHSPGYAESPGDWRPRHDRGEAERHWERDRRGQRSDARSWPGEPTASLSQRRVQAMDTRTASERLRALQAEAAATNERPDRHRGNTPLRRFEDSAQQTTAHAGATERRSDRQASTTMTRQQSELRTRSAPSRNIRTPQPPRTTGVRSTGRSPERARSSTGTVNSAPSATTNRSFGGANAQPRSQPQRQVRPAAAPQRSAPASRPFGGPASPPRHPD